MGQYHYVVNFDRKEFIHPHKFGDGLKLLEFGSSGDGTMFGLAILLAASNRGGARGGGDLHPWIAGHGAWDDERVVEGDPAYADALMQHIVGRWAGDRIAIVGDYYNEDDVPGGSLEVPLIVSHGTPWEDDGTWTDISDLVVDAIELDYYVHQAREGSRARFGGVRDERTTTLNVLTGEVVPWP